MKPLSHYIGAPIECTQPSLFKRKYEAALKGEKVFSFYFPSLFKLEAVAECFDKIYKFKSTGIFSSNVDIREEGFELPFAKYSTTIWKLGGAIQLPRGEKLKLDYNVWKGIYTISTESGLELLKLERRFGFKEKGIITILEQHPTLDANPWLPALVLFIDVYRRGSSG